MWQGWAQVRLSHKKKHTSGQYGSLEVKLFQIFERSLSEMQFRCDAIYGGDHCQIGPLPCNQRIFEKIPGNTNSKPQICHLATAHFHPENNLVSSFFPPFFLLSPMLTSIKKPSLSKPPWSDPRFCFADCCSCQACSPPSCLLCKLAGGFVDSRMGLFKTRGTPHPFTNRYTNNEMDYAGVPLFSFTPTWVFFAVPVGYCPE